MEENAGEARAAPLNPLTDAELQMIEARQAVGLSVTDTLARALCELRAARRFRQAFGLFTWPDVRRAGVSGTNVAWVEVAGRRHELRWVIAAQPPPDSVSESLREARRLLGEARDAVEDDHGGLLDDCLGCRTLRKLRAFLGDTSGEPAAGPSSPLDPGEQKT